MKRVSSCRATNEAVLKAVADGWRLTFGGRHPKLQSPDGLRVVSVPVTPSDRRGLLNFIHQLRRIQRQQESAA